MEYKIIASYILHELGIGANLTGYEYVLEAMRLIDEDRECLCFITKSLYVDLARKFGTKSVCVEKNIRTVVRLIWEKQNGNEKMIRKVFGEYYLHNKPTNAVFLERLYDYVKNCRMVEVPMKVECPFSNKGCVLYYECVCRKEEN